jgi:hypothetical protein
MPPPAPDVSARPRATLGQPGTEVNEVPRVAPEPIDPLGDQGVAGTEPLQARLQSGPVGTPA